jgi:hypothetical protein
MAVPSRPWKRCLRTLTCSGQLNFRKMCSNSLCRNPTTKTSTTRLCRSKSRPRTAHLFNLKRCRIPTSERLIIQPTKMCLSQSSVASQRRLRWPLKKPLNLLHPNSNRWRQSSEMRATRSCIANHQGRLTKSRPSHLSSEWSRSHHLSSSLKNRRSKVLKRCRITMRRSMK